MKILITGGSGLLGQYLTKLLSVNNEVLATYNNNIGILPDYNSIKVDITDSVKMTMLFGNFLPDVVIHTACYSRPEICAQLTRDEVYRVNVEATENIARLSKRFSAKLIYTSTDLVYDGNAGGMVSEDSTLNPISLYAESKLMAEIEVQKYASEYIILRTALLLGFGLSHTRNNFHITYEKLKAGEKVNLFYDQYRTPLSLNQASEFIEAICKMKLPNSVVNFGGREKISRLQIGEYIADAGGFNKKLINKISCKYVSGVPQVPDVSMDTSLLQSMGLKARNIKEEIYDIVSNIK